jgi:hypothetical protein
MVALAGGSAPVSADAAESATLSASLTPERLGQAASVGFGFQITGPGHGVPPPLTAVEVSYPGNLGVALSGLGLVACSPTALEAEGLRVCSSESRMGVGQAFAEIAVGPEILHESADVTILRAPGQEGRLSLLFYVDASAPVSAQIALPGVLLPAPAPFGGLIDLAVPLVPGLPEGPDVAVVSFRAVLGPRSLTYYERVGGKRVAYHPRGILLPRRCPAGGFPFAAHFSFLDGSSAEARASVGCPTRPGRRGQHR